MLPLPESCQTIVGVMGAGDDATPEDITRAEALGEALARAGYTVLTGGRDAGLMAAALRGAARVEGSCRVAILSNSDTEVAPDATLAIVTDLGQGRNVVNVLSSRVVVAVGSGGPGTASEVALALKYRRPVVLLSPPPLWRDFFMALGAVEVAETVEEALGAVRAALAPSSSA